MCFLLSALAAFAVVHFTFLKPKWQQLAANPKFPGTERQISYWSIRGQFELQMWLGGVNYPSRGANTFEYARAVAAFLAAAIVTTTTCQALSGEAS